ncbi:MAG: uroporphyrinogen-III synthase, partial [Acidimicrobiales bacterium]
DRITAEMGPGLLEDIVVGVPAARKAEETAAIIRRYGGIPMVAPTLEEVPPEDDRLLEEATRHVIGAPAGWSVHLTGVGTRRWLEAAAGWGLLDPLLELLAAARLVARGAKATAALRSYRLKPEWVPAGETSTEIAEWMSPRLALGAVVAIQGYGEPLPELVGALEGAGARTIEVSPYRWVLPEDLAPVRRLVTATAGGEVQALVVTSAPQVRNLFSVAREQGYEEPLRQALRSRVFVAAVGPVAARALESEGAPPDLIPPLPRLGALIKELASCREKILSKSATRPMST